MAAISSILLASAAAIGTGVKIYGDVKANHAQAKAEETNAAFYKEQADFATLATQRSLDIYRDESETFRGNQASAAGRGGVTLSGSPLLALADTRMRQLKEESAIVEDGRMKTREALLKAGASMDQADRLSSFSNNFLPALSTTLTNAAVVGTSFRKR